MIRYELFYQVLKWGQAKIKILILYSFKKGEYFFQGGTSNQ